MNCDSMFGASVRRFFKTVATILGIAVGIGIIALIFGVLAGPDYLPPKAEVTLLPDAKGNRSLLPSSAPAVVCLNFQGVIGLGDLTSDKVINLLLDSQEDFLKGGRVKALLLHMDTPGGSAVDSDTIYRALMSYKKKYSVPIYAYVDGLCASGGMYIACAADKIYATPPSVIGSVGVLMGPNFNFSEAMVKYGVAALTLTEGKDKDELNPFRPWKPNEGATLQPTLKALYDRFVSIVSSSRPKLTKEQLVNNCGAHVFIAQEAEQLGYVDSGNADYTEALDAVVKAAQIGDNDPYQVIQLTPRRSLFCDFAQSISPVHIVQAALGITPNDVSHLKGQFLYYYQP